MQYDNNNSGRLFRNEDKEQGSKQPDYRGDCEVNGVKLQIAGWIRTAKASGKDFISLKFSPPFKKEGQPAPRQEKFVPPPPKSDETDSVPF